MMRMDQTPDIDVTRKRLIYRSWHRGTREMDLILGRFADAHVPGFSAEELTEYERLLNCPDPDLYDWVTGQEQVPANLAGNIMDKFMRSCAALQKTPN